MKLAVIAAVMMASSSLYAEGANCTSIKNGLDRKYCMDKYLETVKVKHKAEKKAWGTSITGDAKAEKTEAIEEEIQSLKDQQAAIQSEITLQEKHLADLNALTVTAAAAPVKKKKEKKKFPFGIKL